MQQHFANSVALTVIPQVGAARTYAYGNNNPNNGSSYDQRQNQSSLEAIEIDPEKELSTIGKGTGETMGTSLVLHRLKGETIHKEVHTASQEVISQTILLSADLIIDLRPGLHPTNKNFHKTIMRRLLRWFALPQPMIPLTNSQISDR